MSLFPPSTRWRSASPPNVPSYQFYPATPNLSSLPAQPLDNPENAYVQVAESSVCSALTIKASSDLDLVGDNHFDIPTPPEVRSEVGLFMHIAFNFDVRQRLIAKAAEVRSSSVDSVQALHDTIWFPLLIHPTTTEADILSMVYTRLRLVLDNPIDRL